LGIDNIDYFRPTGEPDADYDTTSTTSRETSQVTDRNCRGGGVRACSARSPHRRHHQRRRNADAVLRGALRRLGLKQTDIGFWCSGSSDYLAGRAFSFLNAIDSIGAVPPINESHVEMDGAWALYEAYIKILTGAVDTALVYGFGKSSAGVLRRVLALQTDPYTVAPLMPDAVSTAGLQARFGLDSGKWSEEQMAQVATGCYGCGWSHRFRRARDFGR